ncbi:MAG: phosphoenolpyruvate--protein phosphotransferase [Rhodospirillales bacterium]|nr:phosphoenolpyruvate--protein phosphotransferase [Rhodospirillales bacterium]
MLEALRRIVEEVSASPHRNRALAIIVRRVREAMRVDACSVYLFDAAGSHLVLMATDGLDPAQVGIFRVPRTEGFVGQVGERQQPLNLTAAPADPRSRDFPELADQPCSAFLGVPLMHLRRVLGVLVVQRVPACLFSSDEVAFLVTIAAQLAGAINDVTRGDTISQLLRDRSEAPAFLQGIPGIPGVAIGTIMLPDPLANLTAVPDRRPEDMDAEEASLRAAVIAARNEIRDRSEDLRAAVSDEAKAILDAYVMLLDSDRLIIDAVARIRAGNWAPGALRETIAAFSRVFEEMEDPYLRARAEDMGGLGRRILMHLQSAESIERTYPENCILMDEEISLARMADVPVARLVGVVGTRGSVYSHAAILARSLGIPAVMGLGDLPIGHLDGVAAVIDGFRGRVFINPSPAILHQYQRIIRYEKNLSTHLATLRDEPAITPDGMRIGLQSNVAMLSDLEPSLNSGAEGIGLYRTEFSFMLHDRFPSEEEQCKIYRQLLEAFAPRPVVMRTLDIGGDKSLPYFPVVEDNPFLGWRGIRVTLDHPEIFLIQLRALLRANAGLGNLHLAFPMISAMEEVDVALDLMDRAYRSLREEDMPAAKPQIGVIVEVPSATYLAPLLARQVDFVSIGTNDLTQFLLAVDRNNSRVAPLYDSLHPAVIDAVHRTVRAVHGAGKKVSVCGEMAGDPPAAILLLGMGVDTLSMASPRIPRIKKVIRTVSRRHAEELLNEALSLRTAAAVRSLLNGAIDMAGLGMLVGPAKP